MAAFSIKNILSNFPECRFVGNDKEEITEVIGLTDAIGKNHPHAVSYSVKKYV